MNRLIPIIVLIFLVIMLGGALWLFLFQNGENGIWKIKKETINSSYEEQLQQEKIQAEQDSENYNAAIRDRKLSYCEGIKNPEKKSECRDMVSATEALYEKNTELCTTINSEEIRNRCQDNIFNLQAEEKSDITLCEKIQDETIRVLCKKSIEESSIESHLASGSLDLKICENITDTSLMEGCKRKVLSGKDSEFYRQAVAETSLLSCDQVLDSVIRIKCRDTVLFDLAIKEGNLDYCTGISETERSDYCNKALLSRQDVSRYQQFVRTGDLDACSELTVIQMKNQCRDTIIFAKVRETLDESLCELLYNTGITTQCREIVKKEKEK